MSLTAELFCLMKESYNTDPKQEFSQYKEFNDMRSELGAAPRETLEQIQEHLNEAKESARNKAAENAARSRIIDSETNMHL